MNAISKFSRILQLAHSRNGARIILCGSLLLTFLAWHLTNLHVAQRHRERFAFRVSEIQSRISERMLEYEQVLRGGVSLFSATDDVNRTAWANYVKHCRLPRYFPGIQAMGFAVPVPQKQLAAHVAAVRAEGFPDYQVTPQGDREDYTAIVLIEPFDWRNRRAFGYDMYSDATRRKAMDTAASSGFPAISGKITLVQETDEDVQAGVLCYLPVYRNEANLDTPAQRKTALRGWVYAAFRCDDLMRGTINESVADVECRIFDGRVTSEPNLLFNSESNLDGDRPEPPGDLYAQVPVTLSGREWTLQIAAKPKFVSGSESSLSSWVVCGGLTIDMLLFAVISGLGRQRENALAIANRMTKELSESELWTRSILENASEAILSVSEAGTILAANHAAHTVFEWKRSLVNLPIDALLVNARFEDLVEAAKDTTHDGNDLTARCRRLSGTVFPCRISIGRVSVDSKTRFTIIAHDETARMESETQIADINRQLIESSHKAGIAEVATGVLHNVGNVLNSVTTSSGAISKILEQSAVSQLAAASEILRQHAEDLEDFLTNDPRGVHFPGFLEQVSSALIDDQTQLKDENRRLIEQIQHIREIIRVQQEEVIASPVRLPESPVELMNQAVQICESRHAKSGIQIQTEIDDCPTVLSDRHKILQVLTNLIANAQDAVADITGRPRIVTVRTRTMNNERVEFIVEDNGVGMTESVVSKVLNFGFTTKRDGHGFGLHSCAQAAKALGGELHVRSDGINRGSVFSLFLPLGADHASDAGHNSPDLEMPSAKLVAQ
ncbi:CHASE domain-containing protein [Fuerstiella marisgermanici]|uniref:histidine kinase n=1 Tax=Fuerstiella marisgermanici TaxID=1891926 RepID=A0A1P8WN50_9PLAN|nr:CHASE domain-containing protein [Fuerstiella marisgermanici]APZ95480.1 Sensor protein FixL [Fuerstiella marisgermanici]